MALNGSIYLITMFCYSSSQCRRGKRTKVVQFFQIYY